MGYSLRMHVFPVDGIALDGAGRVRRQLCQTARASVCFSEPAPGRQSSRGLCYLLVPATGLSSGSAFCRKGHTQRHLATRRRSAPRGWARDLPLLYAAPVPAVNPSEAGGWMGTDEGESSLRRQHAARAVHRIHRDKREPEVSSDDMDDRRVTQLQPLRHGTGRDE